MLQLTQLVKQYDFAWKQLNPSHPKKEYFCSTKGWGNQASICQWTLSFDSLHPPLWLNVCFLTSSWSSDTPVSQTGPGPPPGSAWSAHQAQGSHPAPAGHSGGSQSCRLLCTGPGPLGDLCFPSSLPETEWCHPLHLLLLHFWKQSQSPGLCCCLPALCPGCELLPVLRGNIERFLCCATCTHTTHRHTKCLVRGQAEAT